VTIPARTHHVAQQHVNEPKAPGLAANDSPEHMTGLHCLRAEQSGIPVLQLVEDEILIVVGGADAVCKQRQDQS